MYGLYDKSLTLLHKAYEDHKISSSTYDKLLKIMAKIKFSMRIKLNVSAVKITSCGLLIQLPRDSAPTVEPVECAQYKDLPITFVDLLGEYSDFKSRRYASQIVSHERITMPKHCTILQLAISHVLNDLSPEDPYGPAVVAKMVELFGHENIVGINNLAVRIELLSNISPRDDENRTIHLLEQCGIYEKNMNYALVPFTHNTKATKIYAELKSDYNKMRFCELYHKATCVDCTLAEIEIIVRGMQEEFVYYPILSLFPKYGIHYAVSKPAP